MRCTFPFNTAQYAGTVHVATIKLLMSPDLTCAEITFSPDMIETLRYSVGAALPSPAKGGGCKCPNPATESTAGF